MNSVQSNLRIQSSLRSFIVFCEEIWKLCNCVLMMFVFRSFEPWYQKDSTVSCLSNLVDAVCLTSITSQYSFLLCKSTSYWNDLHNKVYLLHIKQRLAWRSHWEATSPWSDTNVNSMNLVLLKYVVPMSTTFFNAHSLLCILRDFDDQQWVFPYAALNSWCLFWFCEVWTGFLYIVWVNFKLKRVKNLTCFLEEILEKYESVYKRNVFRNTK